MHDKEQKIIVLLLVVGVPALVFLPSLFVGFNPFWDLFYVYQNPFQRVISLPLVRSAFISFVEGNYHPLTLISHSLDYTVWRDNPFGHHLSSYLLHLVNVWLVFILIKYLTRKWVLRSGIPALYIAGLTAVIFGIHPLRVESVTWITERKDVLCAFFYLLTIYLFVRARSESKPQLYWLALFVYLGGVLSKAMAVSLPAVVMILDYRELSPPGKRTFRGSLFRGGPFAILAAAAAFLAMLGQYRGSLMAPLTPAIILSNLLQLPGIVLFYVGKTLWPFGMSPLYPIELIDTLGYIIFSWIILTSAASVFWFYRKQLPSLFTGLAIFIILLLPVGGLVRVGAQVLADRFSYLPTIPVIFALSTLSIIMAESAGRLKWLVVAALVVWMVISGLSTISYISIWDNPIAVTRRAYDRYPGSSIIRLMMLRTYNSVAAGLVEAGQYDQAIVESDRAISLQPDFPDSYQLRAHALERAGRLEQAEAARRKADEVKRKLGERYFNQGLFHAQRQDYHRAEELFRETLIYNEARVEAYYNLAVIYQSRGDLVAAATELKRALAIYPDQPVLRRRLESILKLQEEDTNE
jgi:protein O-mannosyl-transferase